MKFHAAKIANIFSKNANGTNILPSRVCKSQNNHYLCIIKKTDYLKQL